MFYLQQPFRLMHMEATENGLIIKNFGEQKTVNYRDIRWVANFDLSCPWFVTVKYKDQNTGLYKKASYMPNQKDMRTSGDDAMTEFIKNKIISENPNYSKKDEPSKVRNVVLLIFINLPFSLLALHFLGIF